MRRLALVLLLALAACEGADDHMRLVTIESPGILGLSLRELPAAERKTLGVDYGVLVTDVSRSAQGSPIQPGDVIIAVNQSKFSSLEEFDKLIAAREKGETVALLVRRGEGAL